MTKHIPWVLIDTSWLAHRALYAMPELANDETPTGVIYGFLEQLYQVCTDSRVASNRVALFLDSRHSYRQEAYPAYKRKRQEDRSPEDVARIAVMHKQMAVLTDEVLPAVGLTMYRQRGLESDDLMAYAAKELSTIWGANPAAVMVTADGDLYQCITPNVHFYNPQLNLYLDSMSFVQKYWVDPEQWGNVKAMAGCDTDNVDGVPGVGKKTACDYIKHLLNNKSQRYQSLISAEGKAIIARNKPLVVLPHARTKPVRLVEPQYNAKAFFRYCRNYGIDSFCEGPRRRQWQALFAGDMDSITSVTRRQARRGQGI